MKSRLFSACLVVLLLVFACSLSVMFSSRAVASNPLTTSRVPLLPKSVDVQESPTQEINLAVPYVPQVPPGEWDHTRNCGQTSSAMIYGFYGFYTNTPGEPEIRAINSWLATNTGNNTYLTDNGDYTSLNLLTSLAKNYAGFSNSYYANWTLNDLKQSIQNGIPVIAHAYTFMSVPSHRHDLHFLVVRGVRLDGNGNVTHVIVNDPGRSLASGAGQNYAYDVNTFMGYWNAAGNGVVVISGTPAPICSAPANGQPRDNVTLNNRQVTFTWTPPSCQGLDSYTFRVANHADIDNPPWIIDHGVNRDATSTTESIPAQYEGPTLYWAIWPHNSAGYGAKGGVWQFKINTAIPPTPTPLPVGTWNIQYFSNKELTSQCASSSFSRTFIFQDWGEGAPAGGCPTDNWGARFTRQLNLQGGYYTFGLKADDWGRIYVDNNLVVDKWNGASQVYEGRTLSAGTHDVRIEFADTAGLAKLSAWWWGPGYDVPHEIQDTNQWYANYWLNPTLWEDSFAKVNEGTGKLNHQWDYGSPGWDMPIDSFSAKFQRTVYFECGRYRFTLDHDDGARFYLDGTLQVDRWSGVIGAYTFDLDIARGYHTLEVQYYENGGAAHLSLDWVQLSNCAPSAPALSSPADNSPQNWNTDLTLIWNSVAGATDYYAHLQGGPGVDLNSQWVSGASWHVGGLWPGTYTWSVKSRNDYGTSGSSPTWTFTIPEPPPIETTSRSVFLPLVLRSQSAQWVTLMTENFEGAFPGDWQTLDNNNIGYVWKDRSCKSYTGSWGGWAVGGGSNGLSLGCGSNYPDNARTWMIYGPVNLSDATAADLQFKLWLNSEPGYDTFKWGASTNGAGFAMYSTSGNSNGWSDMSLNLADLSGQSMLGQSNVWVAFLFESDSTTNYPDGAYIDDIVLRKCAGGICSSAFMPQSLNNNQWSSEGKKLGLELIDANQLK